LPRSQEAPSAVVGNSSKASHELAAAFGSMPAKNDTNPFAIFKFDDDPMGGLMKFLTALFFAVKREEFMRTVHDMTMEAHAAITDFQERSSMLAVNFGTATSGSATKEDTKLLTGQYFNNQAKLMTRYYETRWKINKRKTRSMPSTVAEVMLPMLETMTSQEFVNRSKRIYVETDVEMTQFCAQIDVLMTNVTQLDKGMGAAKKHINGTIKLFPMVKNYLDTMDPGVVPRVMWVLGQMMDTEWMGADNMEQVTTRMLSNLRPAVQTRLHCQLSKSGTGPRSGAVLLAALAWTVNAFHWN